MRKKFFESVWDAIEPSRAEAANMKARAETMIAIQRVVSKWRLTQAATAKRLGLTQPRLNDLLRGRINKFNLETLINIATAARLEVRVEVKAENAEWRDLINAQVGSLAPLWNNAEDKVWDNG